MLEVIRTHGFDLANRVEQVLLTVLRDFTHFVHVLCHVLLHLCVLVTEAVNKLTFGLLEHVEARLAHFGNFLVQRGLHFANVSVRIVELVLKFLFVLVDFVGCVDTEQIEV